MMVLVVVVVMRIPTAGVVACGVCGEHEDGGTHWVWVPYVGGQVERWQGQAVNMAATFTQPVGVA